MLKKVLVVEDYDDSRYLMRRVLEVLGYEVIEATDGSQAVELTRTSHPDLILMDMSLPVMDGLSATRLIKESKETADIPVICITAHGEFYFEKALQAGCDGYIDKPVDIESVQSIVSHYLAD